MPFEQYALLKQACTTRKTARVMLLQKKQLRDEGVDSEEGGFIY